jgi:hypothetical protein
VRNPIMPSSRSDASLRRRVSSDLLIISPPFKYQG